VNETVEAARFKVSSNGIVSGFTRVSGRIDIYTLGGKLLMQEAVNPGSFEVALQFSQGVYLIVFESGNETYVKKAYIP